MKLLNKIFNKKGSGSDGSSGKSQPPSPEARCSSHYNCTTTTVGRAKVLRLLGAENKDQENQIIRTLEMQAEMQPDSTDISFEDDAFEEHKQPDGTWKSTTPNFGCRRSLDYFYAPPRCSSDTDTFDPPSCESRSSMSPTLSPRLSPAGDPWCRSPQHSPRSPRGNYYLAAAAVAAAASNSCRDREVRPVHPLPTHVVPLRDRVGNNLRVAAPAPSRLPLPPQYDNSSARMSPLPSPPGSPLRCYAPAPQPQSPRRLSPGSVIKYQRLQELGRGSYATVYEVFMENGSFCAVKVIHDPAVTEDTMKEVTLLSKLNHPHIVSYLGACIDESGALCIFLELMKYSLKSILDRLGTGFEENTIRSYTRQILHGLAYLHEQDTIHRDIKCANILVDSQGQVKLGDFGVAKQTPQASSLKGTPIFMAPEVVVTPNPSMRSYGTAVDIWSLGCTVLEMANGKPPWSDLGFGFYFKMSKGIVPPIPDCLSPTATEFVQQCLQYRPKNRPTAAALLQHPFVRDAPSSVPSFASPLASPRASPMHRHAPARNIIQETHFHPIEGLQRNGNLNLLMRDDPGISAVIHRTRQEPQQMIFRNRELQGLVFGD